MMTSLLKNNDIIKTKNRQRINIHNVRRNCHDINVVRNLGIRLQRILRYRRWRRCQARSNIVRDLHKGSPGIGINFYALICTVAAAFIVPCQPPPPPPPPLLSAHQICQDNERDARAPRGQLARSSNLVGKCRALATVPLIIPRRYPRRRRNGSFTICLCILRARNRVIARPRFSFHHLFVWRHVRFDWKERERKSEKGRERGDGSSRYWNLVRSARNNHRCGNAMATFSYSVGKYRG